MDYPYQEQFERYLKDVKKLKDSTIADFYNDLTDFFNYESHFNRTYQEVGLVKVLRENDVRDYLEMLSIKREYKNTTYNKVLSHLNIYFIFLFTIKASADLPTINIHGKKRSTELAVPLNWTDDLETYLADERLTDYTRLIMLLTARFYSVKEMMAEGFYRVLEHEDFTPSQATFYQDFRQRQATMRLRQACDDLFLKQHIRPDAPRLTIYALHKYLNKDTATLGFKPAPREMLQAAVMNFIIQNQSLSDTQLMNIMHLPPQSLAYYRNLILKKMR